MDFLEKIEHELKNNILKPNEYMNLAKKLGDLGLCDLSNKVLQTGSFTYRNNLGLTNLLNERGLAIPQEIKKKVFVIGLSRTGTNSLSTALREYSLSGAHWNGPNGKPILDWEEIEHFQFVSDTPVSFIFETLYYAYPDAYFIYTTREVSSWAKSLENHFEWSNGFQGFKELVFRTKSTPNKIINIPLWAVIHRNLYANASSWEDAYNKFDRRVKKFFSNKKDANLLMLDVGLPDEEKWIRLSEFLGTPFTPLKPFPRKNIKLQKFDKNLDLIHKILGHSVEELKYLSEKFTSIPVKNYISKTIEKPNDLILPTLDEENIHYAISRASGKNKELNILKIPNAYISFDFTKKYSYKFYIFNENKEYLDRCSHGESPFILDEVQKVDKSIGFIEDKFSNFNVCHLLTDKLSRIFQIEEVIKTDGYILYHNNSYIDQIKKLLALNILDITQKGYVTLKIKELICSSSSTYSFIHPAQNLDSHFNKLKARITRGLGQNIDNKIPRKFFIDRSGANSRNIVNIVQLNDLLDKYKIEKVKLESLSLLEQIELFSCAELVIGVHGAGLTNVMFCKSDTNVIEILPALCATPAFYKISIASNLNYRFILARDEEYEVPDYQSWKHNPGKYNRRNVLINIDELDTTLSQKLNYGRSR
ncbi:sulfotransferase [Alteromonas sp. C1M14]|uniref:sulfotransferase n=1 Tax=Alteromonas sp. C1M14 TaxID=2841567 RepID=UPI001C099FC0|nr:sulfotransferase [Alteromonas sp. C1M14]MBU2977221.1 DUF563 domain-containing protein [Alteromonas sp. C1M14]